MLNPIILIVTVLIIFIALVICIFRKKKALLLTSVNLIMTGIFLGITGYIESAMESSKPLNDGLLNILVMSSNPSYTQLSGAFLICQIVDVILFVAVIVSLIYEVRSIFKWNGN